MAISIWTALLTVLASFAAAEGGTGLPAPAVSIAERIRVDDLLAAVRRLSASEMGGRLPGTSGYDSAAGWAVERFARCGLRPLDEHGGYRQRFTVEANRILAPCRLGLERDGHLVQAWRLGPDFVCRGFSGAGLLTAPVVFVGYGLSLPEFGYDDYAGVDVAGKIVLAFKPAPGWPPPAPAAALADTTAVASPDAGTIDGAKVTWGDAHLPRPKAHTAAAHGAVAMLLVSPPDTTRTQPVIGSVLHGPGEHLPWFPQLHVELGVAEALLAGTGWALATLREVIDREQRPHSLGLSARLRLEVHAAYDAAAPTCNVIGVLPGRDPVIGEEAVVVGAHLDHVGEQAGELLFPGANDNASGAAAVMAIADGFARAAAQGGGFPRRTIVFVLFAAEEQGLLGAKHYVAHPAVPLSRTVAMLNLDCIASGDSLQVGSGKSAPRLWAVAREIDAAGARLLVTRTWAGGGADATPFHEAGVPTLYFATTNGYRHLHQPGDAVETLNAPLYLEMTRLAARVAAAVADGGYQRETLVD